MGYYGKALDDEKKFHRISLADRGIFALTCFAVMIWDIFMKVISVGSEFSPMNNCMEIAIMKGDFYMM